MFDRAAYMRQYRLQNPDYVKKSLKRKKEHYEENREKILEYKKEYDFRNRDVIREKAAHYNKTEMAKENQKRHREKNRDKINARNRLWYHYEGGKEIEWERNIRRKYGISGQDYFDLLSSQNNCCAICFAPALGKLDIDHNHETGTVRGLLCRSCNTALGKFKESKDLIKRALAYLENTDG
jgi:hypothetical protein